MKLKIIFSLYIFILLQSNVSSQTIFWIETFGNGCNQGNLANGSIGTATNGAWSVISYSTGPGNGTQYNDWFISATEAGQNAGTCGMGCIANASLTNRSLHISSSLPLPNLDQAAIYTITANSNSNKLAMSPTISCVNMASIQVAFNYLAGGTNGGDYAEMMYYDGTSWNSVIPLANTVWTCAPKAMWTAQSIGLPLSANGNPNVRIGFRWQNNSGGTNSDSVSIAIDDIAISGVNVAGINVFGKENDMKINVYPNPASGLLTVEGRKDATIEISDVCGRSLLRRESSGLKSIIDIEFLENGIYFLSLEYDGCVAKRKIIKQ